MSTASTQFVLMAKSADPKVTGTPAITYEGQSTFTKYCEDCQAHYPHIRAEDYTECAVCGKRTYAIRPAETHRLGRA